MLCRGGDAASTSVLLTVVSVVPALITVVSLIQHRGQSIDSNCWTF